MEFHAQKELSRSANRNPPRASQDVSKTVLLNKYNPHLPEPPSSHSDKTSVNDVTSGSNLLWLYFAGVKSQYKEDKCYNPQKF